MYGMYLSVGMEGAPWNWGLVIGGTILGGYLGLTQGEE